MCIYLPEWGERVLEEVARGFQLEKTGQRDSTSRLGFFDKRKTTGVVES
jgi:hypothetical protein